jgi:hypothetical protein
MPCPNCKDVNDSRDAAVRACRLDPDAALRERDEANRTGLELVQIRNLLVKALAKATGVSEERARIQPTTEAVAHAKGVAAKDEALKLAVYALSTVAGDPRCAHALAACRAALESK